MTHGMTIKVMWYSLIEASSSCTEQIQSGRKSDTGSIFRIKPTKFGKTFIWTQFVDCSTMLCQHSLKVSYFQTTCHASNNYPAHKASSVVISRFPGNTKPGASQAFCSSPQRGRLSLPVSLLSEDGGGRAACWLLTPGICCWRTSFSSPCAS